MCRTTQQQQQQRFPLNPIFFSFSSQRDRKKKRIVFLFFLFSIHLPSSFFSFSHWLNTPTTSLLLYCSRLSNYLLYNPADRQRLHKNPGTRYLSLSPFSRLFDDLFSPFGYLFLIIMDDYIYIFFFLLLSKKKMKSRSNLLVISTTSWNVHPSSLSIPSVSISFPNSNNNITHHTHMYYYYTMLCVYAVYYM